MKKRYIKIFLVILLLLVVSTIIFIKNQDSTDINSNIKNKIISQWALLNTGQDINDIRGKKGIDINAIEAWRITLGNENVVVGILDTGIDIYSPKIEDSVFVNLNEIKDNGIDDDHNGFVDDINGWDFYNNDNSVYDDSLSDYHGTFISSLISSSHNDDKIWGIAPKVKILPLKFMQGSKGNIDKVERAVEYAYKMGVRIINCSWDNTTYDRKLYETIKKYKDILFVCSSGKGHNNLIKEPVYPACFKLENVICVGSVDNQGKIYQFSGYGLENMVFAPGKDILGMLPGGDYLYSDGTSLATAYITGIAALIKSYRVDIIATDLGKILKLNSSYSLGLSNFNGIIDTKVCLENTTKFYSKN
jgi:subtilisin family serine protease